MHYTLRKKKKEKKKKKHQTKQTLQKMDSIKVCEKIFHLQFHFAFIKVYVFVQQKIWTL